MFNKLIKSSVAIVLLGLCTNAFAETKTDNSISKPAQPIGFTQCLDTSDYDRLSMQAIYADGTPNSHQVRGGSKSVNNITVTAFEQLIAKEAGVHIRIATTALTGHTITLNGIVFTAGTSFTIGASTTAAAKNFSDVLDAYEQFISTYNGSIVFASASVKGQAANAWTVATSTAAGVVLNSSTMYGGQEHAYITIQGQNLVQGTDWTASGTNALTAESIETAINANSTLSEIILATHPHTTSVVYTSATVAGSSEYPISVSTMGISIALNKIGFGQPSDVSIEDDLITIDSHGLKTGMAVLYSTAGSVGLGGLTNKTTYFAIRVNDSEYQLATTSTTAAAGTDIDLTSLPPLGETFTMFPSTLTVGPAGFHWQGSNDGTNKSNLSVSSVTYTAAGNTLWDFGEYNYRYLCIDFVGPTRGGINLTGTLTGRR